ncbi:MAG: hypothetical protein ACTSWG_13200 [Candidatus Helarchaeota archaeon]
MILNILFSMLFLYLFSCLFVFIDNKVDDLYYLIKRKFNKKKKKQSYKSVDEITHGLKNGWLRDKYLYVYRFFLHIKNFPQDFYLESKWFIQRGKRGWSDKDSWSIDWWLVQILPEILIRLKKRKYGIPTKCFSSAQSQIKKGGDYTKQEEQRAKNKWNKILNSIINTFITAGHICNNHWIYCPTKDYYKKENKELRKTQGKLDFIYIMSYKECKQYEEGWKNFQDYFFDLWD